MRQSVLIQRLASLTSSACPPCSPSAQVENLERNEKLRKLDLTVNFVDIDGLLSIESLKINHKLEELYMTGNPCTEFEQYRAFIIGTLPQLKRVDGKVVTATERIQAQQELKEIRARLVVAGMLHSPRSGLSLGDTRMGVFSQAEGDGHVCPLSPQR